MQLEIAQKKVEELSKDGQREVYVDLEPINAFYKAEVRLSRRYVSFVAP